MIPLITNMLNARITAKQGTIVGQVVNVYVNPQFYGISYTVLQDDGRLVELHYGSEIERVELPPAGAGAGEKSIVVQAAAPVVNMAAPVINVPAPIVNVTVPPGSGVATVTAEAEKPAVTTPHGDEKKPQTQGGGNKPR